MHPEIHTSVFHSNSPLLWTPGGNTTSINPSMKHLKCFFRARQHIRERSANMWPLALPKGLSRWKTHLMFWQWLITMLPLSAVQTLKEKLPEKKGIWCWASHWRPVSCPPPCVLIPLSLSLSLAGEQRRQPAGPPVLWSDLAASLQWPPPHLSQTERSTAGQHPGTKAAHTRL